MDLPQPGRRKMIKKVVSDVLIIGAGGVVLLLFKLIGDPYKRGFFCDDESLKHPYKPSTVSSTLLYVVGFALGAVLISLVEIFSDMKRRSENPKHVLNVWNIVRLVYLSLVPFVFGAAVEHIVTDIGKYSVGRLRPHFFSVCNIDYTKVNCTSGYIEDYECVNSDANKLREMRLSFPSGHSSFAAYVAMYLMIYLQCKMRFLEVYLLRPMLQVVIFGMAFFTCLSRISDYKHHPTDVLSGAIVGIVAAVVVAACVSDMFKGRRRDLPSSMTDLNTHRDTSNDNHNGKTTFM